MLHQEGNHAARGIPGAKCRKFTFGVNSAGGAKVVPCSVQGQRAEFIFGDTIDVNLNSEGLGVGYGVPLLSTRHSGGLAIRCLAGGAVPAGSNIIVAMVNFTIDGVVTSLPVAKAASAGADGDVIVAKATWGTFTTAADTDVDFPSLCIEFLDNPMTIVGGETTDSVLDFDVDLALVANGDIVTDFEPGFAGEILSDFFLVTEAVTTAAKAATFTILIDDVAVTGGVISLTSANATPLGEIVNGTAITAGNTFDADSKFRIVASGVTAFVEGEGSIKLRVRSAA